MSGLNCYDCHELEQELKLALLHLDIANAAIEEYKRRLKDKPHAEVYGNYEWGKDD